MEFVKNVLSAVILVVIVTVSAKYDLIRKRGNGNEKDTIK